MLDAGKHARAHAQETGGDVTKCCDELDKMQKAAVAEARRGPRIPEDQVGRRDKITEDAARRVLEHTIESGCTRLSAQDLPLDITEESVIADLRAVIDKGVGPKPAMIEKVGGPRAWVYEMMFRFCNMPARPLRAAHSLHEGWVGGGGHSPACSVCIY